MGKKGLGIGVLIVGGIILLFMSQRSNAFAQIEQQTAPIAALTQAKSFQIDPITGSKTVPIGRLPGFEEAKRQANIAGGLIRTDPIPGSAKAFFR